MKHVTAKEIDEMEKIFRLNLINSITGYKSANLIATKSKDGITNVAVFSSVIHLGSNPPLLGFILRPTTVPRNTFNNLKETGVYTVNHIYKDIIKDAHHTSASYDGKISEFNKTDLKETYRDGFFAPFVEGCKISIACTYKNEYFLKENECYLIIGAIEHVYFEDNLQTEDGFINLEKAETVAVNGLDGYALPKLLERFEYARPKKENNGS